jgi:3-hydroxyacyl-CoA dehydrogenase/enoyl-CoA hydratase/3-hydroxybutyryl-CoA epimerase
VSVISVEHDGRVAVLVVDVPGAPVNTLSRAAGTELLERLAAAQADGAVDAIVLTSGKPDSFIAGADIHELASAGARGQARELSAEGHRLMNAVAASSKPIVTAVHGACLGGGLELALATHYRVATDAGATKLGLPEVQLGLIPAAGGCQRLPRLVGVRTALDLILTGRSLDARRARRAGVVDDVVPPAILRRVAVEAARRLAGGWRPRRGPRGVAAALLDRNPLGRRVVFAMARRQTAKRTGGHYPAPLAAIDAVERGLSAGMTRGFEREAELFGELAAGEVSRRLVELFFATTALKKDVGVDVDAAAIPSVEGGGVVGAGFLGTASAGVRALRAGVAVRLRDTDLARVSRGVLAAREVVGKARARRRIDRPEEARRAALVSGATDYSGFGRRDLVIEAVFEDLDVKRGVIGELEAVVREDCVVASNTSTLPIGLLQETARRPGRVVGMHFFSPVEKMPLVEVIRGPQTSDSAAAAAVRLGRRMGKTVILVRDAPGFWVNRILAPYLNEAGWLLTEGASVEAVDRVMTRVGFPVGPFALLDEVGLDVASKAAAVLHENLGARLAPSPAVGWLIEQGRLGRKSGAGFYAYRRGRRQPDRAVERALGSPGGSPPGEADIESRLLLAIVNEAARACAEGVVALPRDGDIGAIFGFGFPPFLGGPLRYVDVAGAADVHRRIERHAATLGPRFAPAEVLARMAAEGGRFYGEAG